MNEKDAPNPGVTSLRGSPVLPQEERKMNEKETAADEAKLKEKIDFESKRHNIDIQAQISFESIRDSLSEDLRNVCDRYSECGLPLSWISIAVFDLLTEIAESMGVDELEFCEGKTFKNPKTVATNPKRSAINIKPQEVKDEQR